ncbi:MAG: hypothetical protein Q9201_006574 [Fulgogasparrea decipioides]
MPHQQSPSAPLSHSSPTPSDQLPTLTTYVTTTSSDRTSALRLIADSIAQQRQQSSYSLITHPYTLSATILLLGILSQYLDLYIFVTTAAGIIMSLLLVVRALTSPYLTLAEGINYNWLEGPGSRFPLLSSKKSGHKRSSSASSTSSSGSGSGNVDPAPVTSKSSTSSGGGAGRRSRNNSNSKVPDNGVENVVVVSKWGEEEIIGALVMRVLKKEKRAVVRAWTVKMRYRGVGVGKELLEEGVRCAKGKGCVGVEFDGGHANSHRVLPEMFNRGFERREKKAKKMLDEVLAEQRVVGR